MTTNRTLFTDQAYARKITVPQEMEVHTFGVFLSEAGPALKIGLYNDVNGSPGGHILVVDTPDASAIQVDNAVEFDVLIPSLAAGEYWLAIAVAQNVGSFTDGSSSETCDKGGLYQAVLPEGSYGPCTLGMDSPVNVYIKGYYN